MLDLVPQNLFNFEIDVFRELPEFVAFGNTEETSKFMIQAVRDIYVWVYVECLNF